MQVKQALRDARFRESLPASMQDGVVKYLSNPGCNCNLPFYRQILKECGEQLLKYFPGLELQNQEVELKKLAENNWSVINCEIGELESKLRMLGPGRKQLAVARFEDKITVVVNELGYF